MPGDDEAILHNFRWLQGKDGFSEIRPQDIGLKGSAYYALEAMRIAMSMMSTDNGPAIFMDTVRAAELRFGAFLADSKEYQRQLKIEEENPIYKPRDVRTFFKSTWDNRLPSEEEVYRLMRWEQERIDLLKYKRHAEIIFAWARKSGLDFVNQVIPETYAEENPPDDGSTITAEDTPPETTVSDSGDG